MTSLCKNIDCVKMANPPFYYCYDRNIDRKSAKTGRCTTCAKCIKPDFKMCFSCNKEKPRGNILRKSHNIFDLRKAVNAPAYEPKA